MSNPSNVLGLGAACVLMLLGCRRDQSVEPLRTCPPAAAATCILMTLSADPLDSLLEKREPQDSAGYTVFHLRVRGRLASAPSAVIRLTIRGYTDGQDCSAFGQANVAVTGFSPDGYPIILTSAGPVVVEEPSLLVGCPGCGVLLTRGQYDTVATLTSPAWDAALLRYPWDAVRSYDDSGNLYVDTGEACIALGPRREVRRVDAPRCQSRMRQIASMDRPAPGIRLEPGEMLYEVDGARYVLYLARGACT